MSSEYNALDRQKDKGKLSQKTSNKNFLKRIFNVLRAKIQHLNDRRHKRFRGRYYSKRKNLLRNSNFTVISHNCIGGIILHDLGEKFNSPTINLYFSSEDFIKFCSNLKYYISLKLIELSTDEKYPIGQLGDVKINFLHYKSFEIAKEKWEERSRRINYENLYIIMVKEKETTYEMMEEFRRLPYKKVMFVNKVEDLVDDNFYYIKGFENQKGLGDITRPEGKLKYMDQFDFITFFNT